MFNKKIINKSAFLWFEFLSKRFGPGLALHMAKKRTFSCRTNTGNPKQAWVANQNAGFASSFSHIINYFRPFSHDVKAAMLEFQTDPVGVGLYTLLM